MKKLIFILTCLWALVGLTACSDDDVQLGQVDEDTIVATVNGKEITGKEYNFIHQRTEDLIKQQGQDPSDKKVAKEIREVVLNQVIGQELIFQDFKKKGYEVTEEEITEQLDEIKSQYENDEKYQEALKNNNLTEADLRQQIVDQLQMNKYMEKEISPIEITEKDIEDTYEQYKEALKDDAKPLEEVKDQIKLQLKGQKQGEKLNEIVKELEDENDVEILI